MTASDCRDSGRPGAPCPPPEPIRPPQGAPWASVWTGQLWSKRMAKAGRRPQPHTLQLSEVTGFLEENSVASHGPWFGMRCWLDRIRKALATCHEHHVLRQIPAAVAYRLRTVRGGHHSPVAMPFPRSQASSPSSNPILARCGQQGLVLACKAAATYPAWPRPTPPPIHSTHGSSEKSRHVQGHTGQSWARIQVS